MTLKRDKYADFYLSVAQRAAENSVCLRQKVGCVIVKDNNILSIGWNGTVSGYWTNKCEDEIHGALVTNPWVIHAESNAIAKCARLGIATQGADIYITIPPCSKCGCLLKQSGIQRIFFEDEYTSSENIATLIELGLQVICLKNARSS